MTVSPSILQPDGDTSATPSVSVSGAAGSSTIATGRKLSAAPDVSDVAVEDRFDRHRRSVTHGTSISEQFREKLETEIRTADANVVTEAVDGVEFALLDTDGYTHRYDFPPTPLLLDDLHRRRADGEPFATVGVGTDELYVRTTADVSVRDVADRAAELAPKADIATAGVREGKIEFLSGERDAVEDAVVAAVAESF